MSVRAHVLGIAQDGGIPHAGCDCPRCTIALLSPARSQLVACLGLADTASGAHWLIDATPNFPVQWAMLRALAPATRLEGILITHAHMGHYTGLVHLGIEAAAQQDVSLYATASMWAFLESNAPWSRLVAERRLRHRELKPDVETVLSPRLRVRPVRVPHRSEFSDAVGFVVQGRDLGLFYCPDIDSWDDWDRPLPRFLESEGVAVALLDGTFYSETELEGRSMADVAHPLATDTAARLEGLAVDARLIHLNHTNPLLNEGAARRSLARRGISVAEPGDSWLLG